MTRLHTLESHGLIERLKRLRDEVDGLKLTPQQVGASNIVSAEYPNPPIAGWSLITGLAAFQIKRFRITFTYDDSENTYADISTDHVFSGDGSQFSTFSIYDDPANVNDPTRKSWIVEVSEEWGASNAQFYLKVWVRSTDSGTIGIAQI